MGFKIGEIVRFRDGDGRPHRIVDIRAHGPLNRNEHTFFESLFDDGGGLHTNRTPPSTVDKKKKKRKAKQQKQSRRKNRR